MRQAPVQPDVTGNFRGGDAAMFDTLNALTVATWDLILTEAYAENDKRQNWASYWRESTSN